MNIEIANKSSIPQLLLKSSWAFATFLWKELKGCEIGLLVRQKEQTNYNM